MSADQIRLYDLPLFGLTENVTVCPSCGTRTDFMEVHDRQLHVCLNAGCKMIFTATDDEEEGQP